MRKKIKIAREDLSKVKEKRADRNDVGGAPGKLSRLKSNS